MKKYYFYFLFFTIHIPINNYASEPFCRCKGFLHLITYLRSTFYNSQKETPFIMAHIENSSLTKRRREKENKKKKD